jgi:hypothetical protein
MFIKAVATIARLSLLLIPAVAATAASCGGSGKGSPEPWRRGVSLS